MGVRSDRPSGSIEVKQELKEETESCSPKPSGEIEAVQVYNSDSTSNSEPPSPRISPKVLERPKRTSAQLKRIRETAEEGLERLRKEFAYSKRKKHEGLIVPHEDAMGAIDERTETFLILEGKRWIILDSDGNPTSEWDQVAPFIKEVEESTTASRNGKSIKEKQEIAETTVKKFITLRDRAEKIVRQEKEREEKDLIDEMDYEAYGIFLRNKDLVHFGLRTRSSYPGGEESLIDFSDVDECEDIDYFLMSSRIHTHLKKWYRHKPTLVHPTPPGW